MRTIDKKLALEGGYWNWVSSAKGLGVILIIIGHLLYDSSAPWINKIIYSIHVPVFFILSGYTQKGKMDLSSFQRRTKKILLPYLAFTFIGLPFFGYLMIRKDYSLPDILLNMLYVKGKVENNPLWFLVVMFEISTITFITRLPSKSLVTQTLAYICSVILGGVAYNQLATLRVLNLFGINRAIVCFSFYIFGMLIRKIQIINRNQMLMILLPTSIINFIFSYILNSKVSIYEFDIGNYCYFQIAALCGSIAFIIVCKLFFDRKGFLSDISRYSILFLGIQYFIIVPFRIIMRKMNLNGSITYDIWMVLITCLMVLMIPFIYECVKRKMPIVTIFNGESR